jgi:hypothetical protein
MVPQMLLESTEGEMHTRFSVIGLTILTLTVGLASGQVTQRRANVSGRGSPDRGKCTIEVVVDGAAEVEIRGDNGTLSNLNGQPPQWRRFECTSPLPPNPPNFRFTGIDGRGSQELVRGPQNGGVAVVRIQDPANGSEGYTFDLTWGGGRSDYGLGPLSSSPPMDRRPRFTTDQAVRACQDSIRQQAYDRFRTSNIAFRRTNLDDRPGRQEWVTGLLDIRRGYDHDVTYRFSCSVDFDSGTVRSSQLDPIEPNSYVPGFGDARESSSRAAFSSCQTAVEDNLQQKGYQHVDFLSINADNRNGRNDSIMGTARADVRFRSDSFTFSCFVDPRDGDVRSVDVRPSR